MNRRTLLQAAALLPVLPRLAQAEAAWPDRPLRMIVPYPPAGGTDVVARELAQRLTANTGWNVVVENRPGAGGNIGIDAVATARDGHTIGLGQTSNLAINPTLYPTIPYQPLRDLSLISLVASQPNVLVVAKASPLHSTRRSCGKSRVERCSRNTSSIEGTKCSRVMPASLMTCAR